MAEADVAPANRAMEIHMMFITPKPAKAMR